MENLKSSSNPKSLDIKTLIETRDALQQQLDENPLDARAVAQWKNVDEYINLRLRDNNLE